MYRWILLSGMIYTWHCIYREGHRLYFQNSIAFILISLKIVFCFSRTSVDLDEMSHKEAFNLGLYCLPKYSIRSHQCTNKKSINCAAQIYYFGPARDFGTYRINSKASIKRLC